MRLLNKPRVVVTSEWGFGSILGQGVSLWMGFGLVLLQCSGNRAERSAVLDEHLGAGGESADTRAR